MEAKSELAYQMKTETKKLQNKIVELEALNDEIEQELKKEMDANELIVKAMKQENEQLHYTVEEDNSHHEVLIKEKDIIIDKLERTIKHDADKFNGLHTYSEELKKSWEEFKNQTIVSLKLKDEEIIGLKDEILHVKTNHEHLINEKNNFIQQLEQTVKDEVAKCKTLHDFSEDLIRSWEECKINTAKTIKEKDEEIMTVKNTILATEKHFLESKQNNNELGDEICKLKTEIAELTQKMTQEKNVVKTAEDEKNALLYEKIKIKESLVKQSEAVSSLLQVKECLTQQLVEERSLREITEKERSNMIEEKELLEEKLVEEEKVKSKLYQEHQTLTKLVEKLLLNIEEDKETISVLEKEKENMNAELNLIKTNHNYLMEENQDLGIANDNVKMLLEEINTKQASLLGEKDTLIAEKEYVSNSLEAQIDKVNKLEIVKSKLESLVDNLNSEGTILRDTCKDLEEKIKTEQSRFEKVVIQLKEKEKELQCLQQSFDKKIENIYKAEDEVKENAKIVAENRDKFKQEAERLLSINETLNASMNIEKSARDEVEKEKNSLEKKLIYLQAQLEEIKNSSAEIINGLQHNCNNTAEQLKNKETEFICLETQFKLLNEERESKFPTLF